MARIRINPFSDKEVNFDHDSDETLQVLFDRFFKSLKIQDEKLKDCYVILVAGEKIHKDMWESTVPGDCDVIISVVPSGDGGVLRQVLVLTAVIAATYFTAGMATPWATAIVGATAIGASLLVNALIPITQPGLGGLNGSGYDSDSSQSYNISAQSNTVKRYQSTPKVYGRHRSYPPIAANPYTEIEADPETKELAQIFYCVYDFGLGPATIDTVKIGDTLFGEFADASYNLVDFNKPSDSSTEWDLATSNDLLYYKGDVAQETLNVSINKNYNDSGSTSDEYQVTRTTDETGDGSEQEITVTLACPSGLTTYGTNGLRDTRKISLSVEYAEIGTENWKFFNDPEVSLSWSHTGDIYDPSTGLDIQNRDVVFNPGHCYPDVSGNINSGRRRSLEHFGDTTLSPNEAQAMGLPVSAGQIYIRRTYGLDSISNMFVTSRSDIPVGTYVFLGNRVLGKVTSKTYRAGDSRDEYYHPSFDAWWYFYTKDGYTLSSNTVLFNEIQQKIGGQNVPLNNMAGLFEYESSPITIQSFSELVLSGNSTTAVFFSFKFIPLSRIQQKVRITRIRSYGGYTYQVKDDLVWSSLTTRYTRNPIMTTNRHTFLEVRIRATDQINGTIQNLSGVATSVLDVWNGTDWELQITSNPAWVFADLLSGEVNKRAVSKDRLDTDSLLEWANFCDEVPDRYGSESFFYKRFECNFLLDYSSTLSSILNSVGSAAQASLNLIGGKYGVLIDREKLIPVQVFTPRNSSNFSSSRTYVHLPDAFKVKYVDSDGDWSVKEVVVYADGFDVTTAVEFEEIDSFACTNQEQAWRYGRYMLAQAKLRQENITIEVDFENLICTRGDYVLYQQDVMKVGGSPSRVSTVDVGNNRITFDNSFSGGSGDYGYTFRGVGGISSGTLVLDSPKSAVLTGELPSAGDLLVIGEIGKVTINAIVKSIDASYGYKATITLVERANAIHAAESGAPLPAYDPQLSTGSSEFLPPGQVQELAVEPVIECSGSAYVHYLKCTWDIPATGIVDLYEIYINSGGGFQLSGYSTATNYKHLVTSDELGVEHKVKVLAVASNGNKLGMGEVVSVAATPVLKTTLPSDVEAAYINVLNEGLQFEWTIVNECDIDHYLIRYSSSLTAAWFNSIPLQKAGKETSMITVQARTGTYLIKAVDFNGNESNLEAKAITSIPNLINLNIINETNDFPGLIGRKDKVAPLSGALVLQEKVSGGGGVVEYYSEGYYYYKNLLDLGEIYTVRLQSLIRAEGYDTDDLVANWVTLDDVGSMQTPSSADWDVETQYRSTDNYITMSAWTSLDAVAALDAGSSEVWSEWRKLTIGDFTGRVFQFRLKLISNKASVSPRVFDGVIRADVPDRTESYNDIVASASGYNLSYSPAFLGPSPSPVIQITQDDAESGDYYKITSKTVDGFTITFYDKDNVSVTRQFDAMIKGYGRKASAVI